MKRITALILCAAVIFGMLFTCVFADDSDDRSDAEKLEDIKRYILTSKTGKYGMTPIHGSFIKDGTYDITVDSSSPFFKVREAQIKVKNGEITASITINSTSYLRVYPGTTRQAEKADRSDWVEAKVSDGKSVFTFKIEALDMQIDCAAYSKARKRWYDRKLVFNASSLPESALLFDMPDYDMIARALTDYHVDGETEVSTKPRPQTGGNTLEPVSLNMPDGEYSIEVNMIGGSGRASISSPTLLIVRDGKAYARLIWSSAYYDYMLIDDDVFYNLTTDGGNSVFEIPITMFDEPINVVADTTAMGDNLEIDYALTFYEDTVGDKGKIPQEAAKLVFVIALAVIVFGGILNYFVKKKRAS